MRKNARVYVKIKADADKESRGRFVATVNGPIYAHARRRSIHAAIKRFSKTLSYFSALRAAGDCSSSSSAYRRAKFMRRAGEKIALHCACECERERIVGCREFLHETTGRIRSLYLIDTKLSVLCLLWRGEISFCLHCYV